MKQLIFLALILLSTANLGKALENELSVIMDVTYVGKYLDKGFDVYKDHSGIQSSIGFDLYGSGLGVNIKNFRANSSGFEDVERMDYAVYYCGNLYESETYATECELRWIYHHFPNQPRNAANSQEMEIVFCWPKICPGGVVVSYGASVEWPAGSNYNNSGEGGWVHILGLGYDLTISQFATDIIEQPLHLCIAAVYNDGFGGPDVDHDWSHGVCEISTEFELTTSLIFIPALYYQSSWDSSVNTEDEFWASMSLSYAF
jgi:hypothetical protein